MGGDCGGGGFAEVTQRRSISSVSPELAHLSLLQAAEAPRLQGGQICPPTHLPPVLAPQL